MIKIINRIINLFGWSIIKVQEKSQFKKFFDVFVYGKKIGKCNEVISESYKLIKFKYLTIERIDSSIKKWEEFIQNCKDEHSGDYILRYWNPCGFCHAASEIKKSKIFKRKLLCKYCELNKIKSKINVDNIVICDSGIIKDSIVSEVINEAINKRFDKAIIKGHLILDAMKKIKQENK